MLSENLLCSASGVTCINAVADCMNKARRCDLFIVRAFMSLLYLIKWTSVLSWTWKPLCLAEYIQFLLLLNLVPDVYPQVVSTVFCNCDNFALKSRFILNGGACSGSLVQTCKSMCHRVWNQNYAICPQVGPGCPIFAFPSYRSRLAATGRATDNWKSASEAFMML